MKFEEGWSAGWVIDSIQHYYLNYFCALQQKPKHPRTCSGTEVVYQSDHFEYVYFFPVLGIFFPMLGTLPNSNPTQNTSQLKANPKPNSIKLITVFECRVFFLPTGEGLRNSR